MSHEKDALFADRLSHVGDFRFDNEVARVFPDMIQRSVPGYGSILSLLGEIAATYATPNSNIYDLGCSLGASTFAVHDRIPSDCTIHCVDNSPAMLDRLRAQLQQTPLACRSHLIAADIQEVDISQASLAILNFTLQFIPIAERARVIERIAAGTKAGGALILSEKISFPDRDQDQLLHELHHAFKRSNGYSELEIAQKRTALENTLIRESVAEHTARLQQAGYRIVAPWLQCFNFVSILAIK
jgi:tRNA (cmo5U34)-methyltransferase